MTRAEFESMMDEVYAEIRTLNATKGRDYAGDSDALDNFKRHADELGVDA